MSQNLETLKHGPAESGVEEVILQRWSPRSYADKPVSSADLTKIFTAAAWAASSFNEQPWRFLVGKKGDRAVGYCTNSCCEGQGTRLLGSIPEHLYSVVRGGSHPGLYVNMFAPSTIHWTQLDDRPDQELKLTMKTTFPYDSRVELGVELAAPRLSVIRLRTPSWATGEMPIYINGKLAATGKPGSYVALDRTWKSGDMVSFTLPAGFRLTRYTGMDQIEGHERYALEYGPILLAIVGSDEARLRTSGTSAQSLTSQLRAVPGQPLHFAIKGNSDHRYMPYYAIKEEAFTCFPVIEKAPIAR